jgi:orotidine-5'-phosphate decarboxylase
MNAYEKLTRITKENNSILCVGLDTDINKLPTHFTRDIKGMIDFNREIISATKDLVNSYKINFAFYEEYGIEGWTALKKTFEMIPDNIFTIADAKRGDIGNTSKSYAKSCFDYFNADSITVNPYMGVDSVEPFLEYKDKMTFLLCLTSNVGSCDFQRLVAQDRDVYKHVLCTSRKWAGPENLGYVVGATHSDELAALRKHAPDRVFLIPGIGAQGGDIAKTKIANANGPAIVNLSRGIIYASKGPDFADCAREKAEEYRKALSL